MRFRRHLLVGTGLLGLVLLGTHAQPAHAPYFFVRRDKVDLLDRRDLTLTDVPPSAID